MGEERRLTVEGKARERGWCFARSAFSVAGGCVCVGGCWCWALGAWYVPGLGGLSQIQTVEAVLVAQGNFWGMKESGRCRDSVSSAHHSALVIGVSWG